MITAKEASKLIKENLPCFGDDYIGIENAHGYILQEDLFADRDYPPFHRVMMDGIALNLADIKQNINIYQISGVAPAGSPIKQLENSGECLEVMTGAILPQGANLVIPYEDIVIEGEVAKINLDNEYVENQNIHLLGSDLKQGENILSGNKFIAGPHIGIAASIGKSKLVVNKRPRINIISTGDELVGIDEIPKEYQIRRSNSQALKASLNLFGFNEVELSHINDNLEDIEKHFLAAKNSFDILIYSGGVSKGKFDFLPSFWEEKGVQKIFHRVSQRPGKPLWFGVDKKSMTTVLGLPGNPISSLVCLHRYFIPLKEIFVELTEEIIFKNKLTYFMPVKIEYSKDAKVLAIPVRSKNSGEFSILADTDGFIELPLERDVFLKGECFQFYSWRPL